MSEEKVNAKDISFEFKVISQDTDSKTYTDTCSGAISDCCTRICDNRNDKALTEQWAEYFELNAGIVQY